MKEYNYQCTFMIILNLIKTLKKSKRNDTGNK